MITKIICTTSKY